MTRRRYLSLAAAPLLAQDAPSGLHLFLLTGQSNMAGRGVPEAVDTDPIPGVSMLTKDLQWKPAVDPLHFDKPIAGVGIGRSFARRLRAARPDRSIGLIPAAVGGTSLDQWAPGGELFTAAVARAKAGMKSGRLRGILWHQGEADSSDDKLANSYVDRFASMLAALRAELGAEGVPCVAGQLGTFFRRGEAALVNRQLSSIPLIVPKTIFVPSARLAHKGDDVHFDSPSLREFGRRHALAYLSLDPEWDSGR